MTNTNHHDVDQRDRVDPMNIKQRGRTTPELIIYRRVEKSTN